VTGAAAAPRRVRVAIREEADVAIARKHTRVVVGHAGLSDAAIEAMAIAVSEIARNILVHGISGEMSLEAVDVAGRRGVVVIARDRGPGVADAARAMEDGYSTTNSLGLGLPSARRLVDEFELTTAPGKGTPS